MRNGNFTAQTLGTITGAQEASDDFGTMSKRLTVEYSVNGYTYTISEWAAVGSETIKIGPIPIGQRKKFKLPDTRIGAQVAVIYDPQEPSCAAIWGNEGFNKG